MTKQDCIPQDFGPCLPKAVQTEEVFEVSEETEITDSDLTEITSDNTEEELAGVKEEDEPEVKITL